MRVVVLPPNQQLVAEGKFPIVGERLAGPGPETWTLTVDGLVRDPSTWTLAELRALPQTAQTVDIHCVTRWSKLDASFAGVTLASLLDACGVLPQARFVSFAARSAREHSTSLPLADALRLGVLVATSFEGKPLPAEHGGPLRTIVPHRYFYKSVKWVQRIELLAEDRLGFWEAEAGYHNNADPWREERYLAPELDRRTVRRVLQARDFAGLDLRSLDAHLRDLTGLNARGATLRDADFQRAVLVGADFTGANLTNAHLQGADLRGAIFTGADLDGAQFEGADLRGADFTGAVSSFATTFVSATEGGARIDATTRIDPAAVEGLLPEQQSYLRRQLSWS
jgi:DMSO/TMAO reductase YedYZ molybdopterin-dependent catalytic subunit